jgi:hypothetical protein
MKDIKEEFFEEATVNIQNTQREKQKLSIKYGTKSKK